MPCMGPNEDAANHIGEMAYEDVMKLLAEKYYLHPAAWDFIDKSHKEEHQKVLADFKKTIQDLVWYDHCCTF
jgi:hypothetical protein